MARFPLETGGLELDRPTHPGAFLDVAGRRSAFFGYEHGGLEAWVYPLKILDDLSFAFRIEGYPLEFAGRDVATHVSVRPEATILTYSHAAFTVRQILFAPIDEPSLVVLFDVRSTLPMTILGTFRPRLRLMWPAGLMTGNLSWDAAAATYTITEDTRRFAGAVTVPGARDESLMPYQEEPRDVPARFAIDVAARARDEFIPVVIAGSVEGEAGARATAERVLSSARDQFGRIVEHHRALARDTTKVTTPDARLNEAFSWARVGIDKGLATNPLLGTGLVAGFRTSGESERPGFAWFFGRDALWTILATTSYGDFATTRAALAFLASFQREDGKIPHEISQSASLLPWFTDYPYAWASADATPLYVIAHSDYWRASGDRAFLDAHWPSIRRAWAYSASTDTDGNGLIENTRVGHGWVEGGALYPPHEEVYLQGLWAQAQRDLAELAVEMGDASLAATARDAARRTLDAMERTYWLDDRGLYAFATQVPRSTPAQAEPGPGRERRQRRLEALGTARLIDEDTVLPAVPLWWGLADPARAERQIDRLGSGHLATDWGSRLLSDASDLYDPLSYHYGSVWPLFTGWSSMAAYRYGRPHVGLQGLMATAHLTRDGALGYITELLSGDFNAAFGRSSHHQIWSEAMLVTPLLRGLLGLEVRDAGNHLIFTPQLPAHWDEVSVRDVVLASGRADLVLRRTTGRTIVTVTRRGTAPGAAPLRVTIGTALPLDAIVRDAVVDRRAVSPGVTRLGDLQRVEVTTAVPLADASVVFRYTEGSDVYVEHVRSAPGAESTGLRVLRSRTGHDALRLVVEGRAGREYTVHVRTTASIGEADGVTCEPGEDGETLLKVRFDGPPGAYVRRDIQLPLSRK